MTRSFLIALLFMALPASAQVEGGSGADPSTEFLPWPAEQRAPEAAAPTPEKPEPPAMRKEDGPRPLPAPAPEPEVSTRPPKPRPFNRVSLYGAEALGQWNRGLGLHVGFPLIGVRAAVGLMDGVDVGAGFDSFYVLMNEPRAFARVQFLQGEHWSGAVVLEGGMAFFQQRPDSDVRGARFLTGRRNYNAEAGMVFSFRGDSPQSARLFVDVRYHASFDTQPYAKTPLGGVPPPVVLGHNVPVRMGAEMPFSATTSFLFVFGFDVHGRSEDAPFMPMISVGLVTGF